MASCQRRSSASKLSPIINTSLAGVVTLLDACLHTLHCRNEQTVSHRVGIKFSASDKYKPHHKDYFHDIFIIGQR